MSLARAHPAVAPILAPFLRSLAHYIAITGLLNAIWREGEPPTVQLNVVGDYAGASAYAALGIVSTRLEARFVGKRQVVDAAIVAARG